MKMYAKCDLYQRLCRQNICVIIVFVIRMAMATTSSSSVDDIGLPVLPPKSSRGSTLLAQLKLPQCREHCMDKVYIQLNI